MKKTKEMQKGITLIALVITIIILLILAGISIMSLTNTGIFGKAQDAKTKSAEAEANQKATLDEYETELNKYGADSNGGNVSTLVDMFDETGEIEGKLHVGDYISYMPDTASTDSILTELGTYSGSSSNTTETLKQEIKTETEEGLNWRVLDVKNGQVRLISATPTTSKITLSGAKGYNNAVYLLDKTCKTLYNNEQLASKAQNLKIEDIQDYLTYDYTQYTNSNVDTGKYGGTKEYTSTSYRNYPNLFAKEKTGWVDGIQGTELELSEQNEPINETKTTASEKIKITQTYWDKTMELSDFKKEKYYELFISNGNNYPTYWMSSRCVHALSDSASFRVRSVGSGDVRASRLYYSDDREYSDAFAVRPIITLKSNVQIDAQKDKDGSTPEKAYIIK